MKVLLNKGEKPMAALDDIKVLVQGVVDAVDTAIAAEAAPATAPADADGDVDTAQAPAPVA